MKRERKREKHKEGKLSDTSCFATSCSSPRVSRGGDQGYAESDLTPYCVQGDTANSCTSRTTRASERQRVENFASDPEAQALLPSILVGAHRHASRVYINSTTTGKPSLAPQYPVVVEAHCLPSGERAGAFSHFFPCLSLVALPRGPSTPVAGLASTYE